MALKMSSFKGKVEQGGDMLVVDGPIRGEIMFLVGTWLILHKDDMNSTDHDVTSHFDGHVRINNAKDYHFIQMVVEQDMAILIEVFEASNQLGLSSLFELCSRTMASLILDKTVTEVSEYLQLDGEQGHKLSSECIRGCFNYLPLEKRLEFSGIEVANWQVASAGIWSEQEELYFTKQGSSTIPFPVLCEHYDSNANELNSVKYSEADLIANSESIRTSSCRKLPEKFLNIVRRCTNLRSVAWDEEFGQMADTKLARVLEQYCPHLQHVEGTIQKKFEFEVNEKGLEICPASFLDIFEPKADMLCYQVTFYKDDKDAIGKVIKRKLEQEDVIKELKKQRLVEENAIKILRSQREEEAFKAQLRPIILAPHSGKYSVDKKWFDGFVKYVTTSSIEKPGMLDNRLIECKDASGKMKRRGGLIKNEDYVKVSADSWSKLTAAFGLVRED